ncbi:MAG: hypothetical protein AAFP19_16110, partial [Bacteroidota bacterium]
IPDCHKLLLDPDFSKVTFYKKDLPFKANKTQVKSQFELLKQVDQKTRIIEEDQDIAIPEGEYKDLEVYSSIQHLFPLTYGVGEAGLPSNATDERKGQAKQLKGFLLFFDQLLANYLSQLSGVRKMLAVSNEDSYSYLHQLLIAEAGATGPSTTQSLNELLGWPDLFNSSYPTGLGQIMESPTVREDRLNRLLDHLIARFAESFNEYALIVFQQRNKDNSKALWTYRQELINDKRQFLAQYPAVSRNRGSAFNYKSKTLASPHDPNVWDTDNVSGWARRIASLIGIGEYRRQTLVCEPKYIVEYPQNEDDTYAIRIEDTNGLKIVQGGSYETRSKAKAAMKIVRDRLLVPYSYEIIENGSYYQLAIQADDDDTLLLSNLMTEANAQAKMALLQELAESEIEGFHIVEHLLLRPHPDYVGDASGDDVLLPISATCDSCESAFDPYSFRVSVVLPYWPSQYQDMNFRDYIERTIREETPAHIYVKICWVNCEQMEQFEEAYKVWLEENNTLQAVSTTISNGILEDCSSGITASYQATENLKKILYRLRNVYPVATLHDCDEGSDDNPVTLNRTVLGQF